MTDTQCNRVIDADRFCPNPASFRIHSWTGLTFDECGRHTDERVRWNTQLAPAMEAQGLGPSTYQIEPITQEVTP